MSRTALDNPTVVRCYLQKNDPQQSYKKYIVESRDLEQPFPFYFMNAVGATLFSNVELPCNKWETSHRDVREVVQSCLSQWVMRGRTSPSLHSTIIAPWYIYTLCRIQEHITNWFLSWSCW